jgi:hypothetical protein
MRRSDQADKSRRCSFCHKAQSGVAQLISSPSDYPKAYICDECILACAAILEDDRPQPETIERDPQAERNPLLDHPVASEFLTAVERWIGQESLGADGANEFGEMRRTAMRLMAGPVARASKR